MATAYSPTAGADPVWDAWIAQQSAREGNLGNDLSYAKRTVEDNTSRSLEDLGRTADTGRKNISTGLRSRGITRSSVAADKLAGYEGDVAHQQERLRQFGDQQKFGAERSYASAMADLYAQREGQIGDSQVRVRDGEDRARQQQAELERQSLAQKQLEEEKAKAALPPGIDFGNLARAGQPQTPAAPTLPDGVDFGWLKQQDEMEKAKAAIASGTDLGWRF